MVLKNDGFVKLHDHSLHALIIAIDATAVGRLSTITRVVSKSCRKEGKLLVGCMVVTLAKQLQRIHVPSLIATDLQGHTMKNLVRVLVKKTPQIKKLQ